MHPTKREVGFLHQEALIARLCLAAEALLLGSNSQCAPPAPCGPCVRRPAPQGLAGLAACRSGRNQSDLRVRACALSLTARSAQRKTISTTGKKSVQRADVPAC